MNRLRIVAANVAGWNDRDRRQTMFTILSSSSDIILLSETRCATSATADSWAAELRALGWTAFFTPSGTPHTGGTAVLINAATARKFRFLTLQPPVMPEGRVTQVTGTLQGQQICLAAIYAPAQREDRAEFLERLARLPPPVGHSTIAAGDFNCTLDAGDFTGPDRHMAVGRPQLAAWTAAWELQDAWLCAQQLPPGDEGWTKFTAAGHASRIDLVLVSRSLAPQVAKAATLPLSSTDHRAVQVKIGERGSRGRWRLNPSVLQHPHLCSLIAATLRLHLEDVVQGRSSLVDAWVAFKEAAAAHCRSFAKALSRRRTAAVKRAQQAVRAARNPGARAEAERCLQQQEAFERQGELARRGVAAMSNDKPTREFFRRMAAPSTKTDIAALTVGPEQVVTDPAEITERLAAYWKDVYGSGLPAEIPSPQREAAIASSLQRLKCRLSQEQRDSLSAQYSADELLLALKSLPLGSSPGNDGLSASFYIEFWPMVGEILTALLNATMLSGPLSPELLAARVIPFAKTADAAPPPSQFRPISLLGVDYKIMSKAVTRRVLSVMPSLCDPSQTGFIPGRSILHNVTVNRDCIEFHREKPSTAVIAFLDFEKAFDRVSWLYRDRVLQHMGFPQELLRTLHAFYADAPIQIEVNGLLSAPFRATRGTRQGCPLSPCLFSLYAEPLGALLRALAEGGSPTGIALPRSRRLGAPTRLAGCQYADDTTVYCDSPASLERVIHALVEEFCLASGAKLNIGKSSVLLLGLHPPPLPTTIAGIPVLGPADRVSSLGAQYSGGAAPMPRRIPDVVAGMDRNLHWWRQHCASLHSRARLANALLSSKLWFHMQFEPVDAQDLQRASKQVWRCIWGTDAQGRPKRGDVTRERACAPVLQGGLGVIEPAVMHAALKARMVNLCLQARGAWWTAFSEALVERAAGTGAGTGFDALVSPEDRAGVAARCDAFWQQALTSWAELELRQQPPAETAAAAALLVQRALRTAPEAERAAIREIGSEGRQYLSDFYDFAHRRLVRPPRVLTSVPAEQRRNAATHRILAAVTPAELAALAAASPPTPGQLCRERSRSTLVLVCGPAAPAPACPCAAPLPLLVKRVTRKSVIGPPLRAEEVSRSLWPPIICACKLSPLLRHPGSGYLLGEAASTALLAHRMRNAAKKLSIESKVCEMRHYFRAARQPDSTTRPDCEASWLARGELAATPPDWEQAWRAISSANLASYARSLLWRILHHRLPLLSQSWVRAGNGRATSCLLCGGPAETLVHLFCGCSRIQHLWGILAPLASKLGLRNRKLPSMQLTGLLGELNPRHLRSLLPAALRHSATEKLKKLCMQAWTEMRALVLAAIWQARIAVLHGYSPSAAAALRAAEGKVRSGLRNLVYLHLPHLSPWSLDPALDAKHMKTLSQHIWAKLAPTVLRRPSPAALHITETTSDDER